MPKSPRLPVVAAALAFLAVATSLAAQMPPAHNQPHTSVKLEYYSYFVPAVTDYNGEEMYKFVMKEGDRHNLASTYAARAVMGFLDGRKEEKTRKQDVKKAIEWVGKISDPSSDVVGYLGFRFLGGGSPAVPPNREMVERTLRVHTESDHAFANDQYNLGVAYLRGDLLPLDNERGLHWLMAAAANGGNGHAALALGELYQEGAVVPQDLQLAQAFLSAAEPLDQVERSYYEAALADDASYRQELRQMDAEHHAAMAGIIAQGLGNISNTLGQPTAIGQARDQAIANINGAAAARVPQAPLTHQQAVSNVQQALAKATALQTKPAAPTPARAPAVTTTPPVLPANTGIASVALCPASGFVPGAIVQNGDTAVGVQCTPGEPIRSGASSSGGRGSGSIVASSGSGRDGSNGNGGVCHDLTMAVHLTAKWNDARDGVNGFFSNDTISDVTCTWAFHQNGKWADYGRGIIKAGEQHQSTGVWSTGNDSSSMKYGCFEGHDPVDVMGHSCNNLVFTGITQAGTDK